MIDPMLGVEANPALPNRQEDVVGRARFVPPKLRPHILQRPRVDALLSRVVDFPLTVVKAEAGYGKTTALASYLMNAPHARVWYNVGDREADPRTFLVHLIHALSAEHPGVGVRALSGFTSDHRSPRLWVAAVDALSNDLLDALTTETILVLDDYDPFDRAEVNAITERLVETMPPLLHLVITARTMPSLRSRARWRASGEMLVISRAELAFTAEEVVSLFTRGPSRPLSRDAAHAIAAETEGWPIALQMLSEGLAHSPVEVLDHVLRRIPGPSELLFDYLAEEVFLRQSTEVRRFLSESATLRRLDPDACDHVLELQDSRDVLRFLEQSSLFVTADESYRYHNLFANFLLRRSGLPAARRVELHRRAAAYYCDLEQHEEGVYHLLAAGDPDAAAAALARIAGEMTKTGRHRALGNWLDQLPPATLAASPELLVARGETFRLTSRYADALPAYQHARELYRANGDCAGEVRALRGEALVYLDTVQPALARPVLREALRRTRDDRQERASLFLLLAENTLNAGDLARAERLYRTVHRVYRTEISAFDSRVYVRKGAWQDARRLIEANRRTESETTPRLRAPRSHREASALLAWIEAMIGDAGAARQHASESFEVGTALGSPSVELIGLSRVGLGWLSGRDYNLERAREHFDDALRRAERLKVARFKVEPLLGLTILYGIERKRDDAETAAREALAILEQAGDRYLHGIISLALGAALSLSGDERASEWLNAAGRESAKVGDRFASFLALLWLTLNHSAGGRTADARGCFADALRAARAHGYAFALNGTALLAPKDVTQWPRLLRRAQEDADIGEYARALAQQLDGSALDASVAANDGPANAPLYVQTLGDFRVWRQGQEIERAAWPREKALQLLQLLICHRGRPLHREQILAAIWAKSSPATAATGLRVALSALRTALEPERDSGDGHFVYREGETIRLAMDAGIRVDADELSRRLTAARAVEQSDADQAISLYESALALYRGEFLAENRYAAWADTERNSRRREFLTSAERLGVLLTAVGEYERAVRWAETMIQHDPLWEGAYALAMEAYWKQGNRALAIRAYNRCCKRLRDQLGVEPSKNLTALLGQITPVESHFSGT